MIKKKMIIIAITEILNLSIMAVGDAKDKISSKSNEFYLIEYPDGN